LNRIRDAFFTNFFSGVAVSSLIFLTVAFVPFLGSVILILSPLPILFYCTRNGRVRGLAILIVSLCVVAAILTFSDSMAGIPILAVSGCMGMIFSEILKKSYSIEVTILLPVVALLILWSSFIFYQSTVSGVTPLFLIEGYINSNIQESLRFYAKIDVPDETLNLVRENAKQIAGFFVNIFPALALVSVTFAVWLNILSGKELFRRTALSCPDFGDLSQWKAPEKLVWLLIAGGGTLLAPVEWIRFAGLNVLIVCLFVYLLHGLAIISFFFRTKNVPRLLRAFFYFLIFAQQYFTIVVVVAGLFDLWVDFRKYIRPVVTD
jgi:uncharacterized protein YybS (DUF2232 family)